MPPKSQGALRRWQLLGTLALRCVLNAMKAASVACAARALEYLVCPRSLHIRTRALGMVAGTSQTTSVIPTTSQQRATQVRSIQAHCEHRHEYTNEQISPTSAVKTYSRTTGAVQTCFAKCDICQFRWKLVENQWIPDQPRKNLGEGRGARDKLSSGQTASKNTHLPAAPTSSHAVSSRSPLPSAPRERAIAAATDPRIPLRSEGATNPGTPSDLESDMNMDSDMEVIPVPARI